MLSFQRQRGFESATVDGKLYGLPLTNDVGDGASLIFVRKDWMDRLNLEEPKTLDDLIAMAQAFVDNDMSGSGNTIGLGLLPTWALPSTCSPTPTARIRTCGSTTAAAAWFTAAPSPR